MEKDSMDFGELSHDENFKQRMTGFKADVESASEVIKNFLTRFNYAELSPEDKVRYDLFLAFAINSYFWMYLRLKGTDPNEHDIKGQINRVREYMSRSRQIYERKTIMPRLDQDAAKRFVRSGLWTPQNLKSTEPNSTTESEEEKRLKRKRKNPDD